MDAPRWAYCMLNASLGAYCDFGDVALNTARPNALVPMLLGHFGLPPEPPGHAAHSVEVRLLNILGSQGWELVQTMPNSSRFFLKKREA